MSAKKNEAVVLDDGLTVATPVAEKKENKNIVPIRIPKPPEAETGIAIDPYDHVTINGEKTYVRQGEHLNVSPAVFMQLRNKYPDL